MTQGTYAETAIRLLIIAAAALYGAATLAGLGGLRRRRWARLGAGTGVAAWIGHTATVALAAWTGAGWSLWTSVPGAILIVTWLAASSYLVGDELLKDAGKLPAPSGEGGGGLGLFLFPAVALGLVLDLGVRWAAPGDGLVSQPAVLQEAWVPVHSLLAASGWGLFTLAWVAGLMYRVQDRNLRRADLGPLARRLPSLEALDRAGLRLVVAGLLFLGAGLIPGILRAMGLWGNLWFADPKVISTVLAAGAYAAYLVLRTRFGWSARRAAWVLSTGFILTAVNLLVASPFLSRFHQWL